MRIGWFTPVSAQTGISAYSQDVLQEMRALYGDDEVSVTVYHPPTADRMLQMPYPTIELSATLLGSDFHALFDVAIYHLGNNEKNHKEIYDALLAHPGMVVMHDYVYQHYLAGKTVHEGFVGPAYGNLAFDLGGPEAFRFLNAGQVLRCDNGQVVYVPWESDWSVQVPFCDVLARLGTGAVVHSDYARQGLGRDYPGAVTPLFMPRPDVPDHLDRPIKVLEGAPIHLVFCGHIGGTKGLSLLSSAFRREPRLRDAFRVTIAGFASDPDFLRDFQDTLRDNNLQSVFDLRIGLAKKEFQEVLASADVFFNLRFPNTEGASLSLAEQLAFGRPVIAYPTGCFAEMPEAAAYFLTRIGDDEELAELLLRIDRERDDLPKRGAAARDAVAQQTPARYAEALVQSLRETLPALARRTEIATARRNDAALPEIAPEDAAWTTAYVESRRLITALFDRKPHLPGTFFEADADDKGRILALNILHARISDAQCRKLGALIDGLDLLEAYDLIGRLIVLSASTTRQTPLVPSYLMNLLVPDFDPMLWRVITMLSPERAIPMALMAMDQDIDDLDAKIAVARIKGTHRTIRYIIEEETPLDLRAPELEGVAKLLDHVELSDIRKLPTVDLDTELLAEMRDEDRCVIRRGFHPVEAIGVWSRDLVASLYLRVSEDDTPSTVSGVTSLFNEGLTKKALVIFTLTEEQSGKSWEVRETCTPPETGKIAGPSDTTRKAASAEMHWSIETPGFRGPVRLDIQVEALHAPRDFDRTTNDARKLGALLQSLRLS